MGPDWSVLNESGTYNDNCRWQVESGRKVAGAIRSLIITRSRVCDVAT